MPALSRRSLLAAGALTGLAACTRTTRPGKTAPDQVVMLTNLGANGRDGYGWVAKAQGYFAAAGLEVEVQPGNPATTSAALGAGRAQFGVVDWVNLAIQHGTALTASSGGPDLRAIAAIQQSTLASVVALESSGITHPSDLMGRTIAYPTGSVLGGPNSLFTAYARLARFDATKVKWAPLASPELTPALAAGKVDGVVQYLVGAPTVEAVAHQPTTTLPFADFMGDLYGGVLVAPQHLIATKPDLVRRFVAALMRGLTYSVDHPDEAGRILHTQVPATQAAPAAAELRLMRPYVTSAGTVGAMTGERVMRALAALMSDGLIPAGLTPTMVVDLDFAPKG